MNRHDCDILVVGAGPAGATAAKLLAEKGFHVLLLDKQDFPRPKLCAGLLTWKTLRLLETLFGVDVGALISKGIIHTQSRGYAIWNHRQELVRGRLDFPFHFVDRSAYDMLWLEEARKAGACACLGEGVVEVDAHSLTALTNRGRSLRAKTILGADGALSRVRSSLVKDGLVPDRWARNLGFALEGFIQRPAASPAEHPAIYFGFIPWGYAWSFPAREKTILGICGLRAKNRGRFNPCFERFLDNLGIPKSSLTGVKGHPLPYGNYLSQPGADRVFLLGDACGLVDPLLGEGLYYAHRSAQIAAQAVIEAGAGEEAFHLYGRRLRCCVIRELRYLSFWRAIVFSLFKWSDYRLLAFFIKGAQKAVEQMVQGQRPFFPGAGPRPHCR